MSMCCLDTLEMCSKPLIRVLLMPMNAPKGSIRRTVPVTSVPTCTEAAPPRMSDQYISTKLLSDHLSSILQS